jgi:chromosome segregation protein
LFLKSLTIKGFKSFADKTLLELEPGIAVVVGPNGSGKSNLVDAIAWVLGAQGPRTLRGGKMDDVIFAGTPGRPALGRAEVSLTIDNSAGLLPIEFSEVTITRTLFRSGDSEYAINGVPCRLLDIQELLSDTGVGRQQHVIVGQGQLDTVLNARPEDRRAIIEEAAGILKYRKRREKAQRRLDATEGNLLRLQDLVREVRRQLKPLERQADAARRHGEVVAELRAITLHLHGRELTNLNTRLGRLREQEEELRSRDTTVRERLRALDVAVLDAEHALTAVGGDDLGDALVRVETLRERARGLAALLAEKRRGLDRTLFSAADSSVVDALSAEAAKLRTELVQVEAAAGGLAPAREECAAAEARLAELQHEYEREATMGEPATPGRAAELRGELAALRQGLERGRAEQARLDARAVAVRDRRARLDGEASRLRGELDAADGDEAALVAASDDAMAERQRLELDESMAEIEVRAADAEVHTWQARAEALALALDEARAATPAERLAGLDGAAGALVDLIEIDPGAEAAVTAALGDAIRAVVVAGDAGRAAVEMLKRGDASGLLLATGDGAETSRVTPTEPPAGATPLRSLVRVRIPRLEPVLDRLLGMAVLVEGEWWQALDIATARPGIVAVTRDGDRFGAGAVWQVGGRVSGATAAALEEARSQVERGAGQRHDADLRLAAVRSELARARESEIEAQRALDANDARLTAAGDALQHVLVEAQEVGAEDDTIAAHDGELSERLAREEGRVAELETTLPALEAAEGEAEHRRTTLRDARRLLDEHAAATARIRSDVEVRGAGIDERRSILTRRLAEIEERLEHDADARATADMRLADMEARAVRYAAIAAALEPRAATIEHVQHRLRERRRLQSEAARWATAQLEGVRTERGEAEHELEAVRELSGRREIDNAEVRTRLEAAVETCRREFDCEPAVAMAAPAPVPPDGATLSSRARELERDLRLMGPINPLALQEFEALQQRAVFLDEQLDDVRHSRRELAKVIRAIDQEIIIVFTAAYADVEENFRSLFVTLFPGGVGRLSLTEPDNPLDTGIEIEARPSGKNVRRLSLLSGGERSLTALAFLFAVFRARPSPFYVLDEVEAALDDVNLHRFLDLIHEFREEAQLLIVSHQKRTMEAGDCLYGVSMPPGGSSIVVSQRVPSSFTPELTLP